MACSCTWPASVDAGAPIHAVFVTDGRAEGTATHPRNFILVERGRPGRGDRELRRAGGRAPTSPMPSPKPSSSDGGYLEHTKIQRESEQRLPRRHDPHPAGPRQPRPVVLRELRRRALPEQPGRGARRPRQSRRRCSGSTWAADRQEVDNHTSLLHAHPNCSHPRDLQGNSRRALARRLQRQDLRHSDRPEDRRQADQPRAAALRSPPASTPSPSSRSSPTT